MIKKLVPGLIFLIILSSSIVQVSSQAVEPTKLKIFVGPTSVPADNDAYSCIFVQLQDSQNKPIRALRDMRISLSSSSIEVGTVDPSMTIPTGATYASANFYSTFTPGRTTIAAAASGYTTVQSQIITVGPIATGIAIYGFPSILPADGGSYDAVIVQLQDSSGSPAKAPKEGVQVSLLSSDTSVGTVPSSVTITQGQTYAIAAFTTTLERGSATITPIASGYTPKSGTIRTQATSAESAGNTVQLYTGSGKLLADKNSYKQIAVQLEGKTGELVSTATDTKITLSSSDETIGIIDTEIIIPKSKTYAIATLTTTYKAGSTVITAAATDFKSSQKTVMTTGGVPLKLAVFTVPSTLPADNAEFAAVQVQLQDAQGRPAKAQENGVSINLFYSDPSTGDVSPTLTIPLGETFVTGNFKTTNIPGSTTITAQASSYTTGQAKITTYNTTGSAVTATNGSGILKLSIKDTDGNALSDVLVTSKIQPAGMTTQTSITGAQGNVEFKNLIAGHYVFDIVKQGYVQLNQTIDYRGQPLSLTIMLRNANAGADYTLIIILSLLSTAIAIATVSGVLLVKRRRSARVKAIRQLQELMKGKS